MQKHTSFLRMNTHLTVIDFTNTGLIAANFVVGFILVDNINLIAAAVGLVFTVAANAGRVAESIAKVRAIHKNGWLPLNNDEQDSK